MKKIKKFSKILFVAVENLSHVRHDLHWRGGSGGKGRSGSPPTEEERENTLM